MLGSIVPYSRSYIAHLEINFLEAQQNSKSIFFVIALKSFVSRLKIPTKQLILVQNAKKKKMESLDVS